MTTRNWLRRKKRPQSRRTPNRFRLSGEQLEPRLLLSGTSYLVNSPADIIADDGVVTLRQAIEVANTNTAVTDEVLEQLETSPLSNAASSGVSDSQVHSLTYVRAIDRDAGVPGSEYRLKLDFRSSLVDDITIRLPWGETTVLSDYLPDDWNGERFEIDEGADPRWMEIDVEPLGTNSDPALDTYNYWFRYEIGSTAVEADAW